MKWTELEKIIHETIIKIRLVNLGKLGHSERTEVAAKNVEAICGYMLEDGKIDVHKDICFIYNCAKELRTKTISYIQSNDDIKRVLYEDKKTELDKEPASLIEMAEELVKIECDVTKIIDTINQYIKRSGKTLEPQHKAPEALQQPNEGNNGELPGNGNEVQPEPTAKPIVEIVKEQLPTIYDDEEMKNLEQRVFYNAINKKYMVLRDDEKAYIWKENKPLNLLAYMCGRLYCDDKVVQRQDRYGKYHKKVIKGGRMKKASSIKDLFNGIDIANNRYQLLRNENVPEGYHLIDNLFEQEKNSEKMAGQ